MKTGEWIYQLPFTHFDIKVNREMEMVLSLHVSFSDWLLSPRNYGEEDEPGWITYFTGWVEGSGICILKNKWAPCNHVNYYIFIGRNPNPQKKSVSVFPFKSLAFCNHFCFTIALSSSNTHFPQK